MPAHVVDDGDPRVLQASGDDRFPAEALEHLRVVHLAEQQLDRDLAPEDAVLRKPDLAPRPAPELAADAVPATQLRPGLHRCPVTPIRSGALKDYLSMFISFIT